MPRPRRYHVAVLGGTFDRLHPGHRALLRAAFAAADEVRIGVTSDRYLSEHPKPHGELIEPFKDRRSALRDYLRVRYPGRIFRILPLNDALGGAILPGPDLLVISSGSLRGAAAVNRRRKRLGLPVLPLRIVPLVRDRSGQIYRSRTRRARLHAQRRSPGTNP